MSTADVKAPRVSHGGDSEGPGYASPPPQEANALRAYPATLAAALVTPGVEYEFTADRPVGECGWCQMIGAVARVAVDWAPADRPDVPQWTDSCLDCGHRAIREGLREVATDMRVRVAILAGVIA